MLLHAEGKARGANEGVLPNEHLTPQLGEKVVVDKPKKASVNMGKAALRAAADESIVRFLCRGSEVRCVSTLLTMRSDASPPSLHAP